MLYGFCWNTTCGCHLSIICVRAALQPPCTVRDTIRLIVAMSDRRSAAADITQTQQSGHHHGEKKNASLVLKRKRLWSKREGSIFFSCMRHILFLQCISIQDALSDFCSLATILSQFKPLVVYVAEILFPAEPPDHEKSVCVTLLRSQHLWQAAALYTHRNT